MGALLAMQRQACVMLPLAGCTLKLGTHGRVAEVLGSAV